MSRECFFCICFSVACVWGQNTTGTILGVIRDSSGAVIAGAKVRIANEATNISVSVVTNASGDYVATNPAGRAVFGAR